MSEKIPIIIPTYNHVALLTKCIESIIKNTDPSDINIVVVANGCSDGTESYVKNLGGLAKLIYTPEPLGYTRAVNVGLAATGNEFVILMNDDVEILDWGNNNHWLNILIDPMKENKSIVATGPSRDAWSTTMHFLVFSLVALRRPLLNMIGGLDDIFNPGGGEDADFCFRAHREGLITKQVPIEFPHWETAFPFYHLGHATIAGIGGFEHTINKNQKILEERWPRSEVDREYSKSFSDGRQNFHRWMKEKK